MIIAVSSMNHFTPLAPFKTFYRSTYDLDTGNSTAYLYGMNGYVDDVLDYVPTAKRNGYSCEAFLVKAGRVCKYNIPEPPVPVGEKEWFKLSSSIEEDDKEKDHIITKIQIHTNSTRVCYIEFDMHSPPDIAAIGGVRFYEEDKVGSKKERCTMLRMFKRTWGEEPFSVNLKFKRDSPGNVTVACGYDEWSPTGGVGVATSLDEIWHTIPAWAGVTKFTTGLLQVRKGYKIF